MPASRALTVCLLASGSGGNATIVEWGATRLLVDAGLSARELVRRAEAMGFDLADFTGIVLSHEHGDHISAVGPLTRRFGLPVYASPGTFEGGERVLGRVPDARPFEVGVPLAFGELTVHPFRTPHDVADSCGFVFEAAGVRLGWCMDLGSVTTLVRERLRHCDGLILEFNHDERLVREGTRPWPVKQRILSAHGHLSNEVAAQLLADVDHPGLREIVVAHISRDHNSPDRPRRLIGAVTAARSQGAAPRVTVAAQHEPTPLISLTPHAAHA